MNSSMEKYAAKMEAAGLDNNVIKTFLAYYQMLASGATGKITKAEIKPPSRQNLIPYQDLAIVKDSQIYSQLIVIKLNGGLGTSMGLSKAKSLLPVKGNLNFLDIIARQILTLRAKSVSDIRMILMDSYNTQEDTLSHLSKYPELVKGDIPLDFVQNKFPRITQADLSPFEHPIENQMWNPPGHGDIFAALSDNGILEKLLNQGIRYAFISNSDNLGATVDASIATYMQSHNIPYIMEVCERSEVDKKGGHLSENMVGDLLLREVAQCPDDEQAEFQNIELYKYFNTNNIWIDLRALQTEMEKQNGLLLLPLIINPKVVDDIPVYQLETAMGSAISTFSGAKALIVPRSRFAPVKKTTDLLGIWSDAYVLNESYQITLARGKQEPPAINLDDRFYGKIDQLLEHFKGVPSLIKCTSLKLNGDVTFGEDVICEGDVQITSDSPAFIQNRVCNGLIKL